MHISIQRPSQLHKRSFATAILALISLSIWADVELPKVFGDRMVLQRNEPVRIWGWADPGENVQVRFLGEEKQVVTNQDGDWEVHLSKQPAGGPFVLTVQGVNKIELSNILIGDLWLCSGQSNMQWQVHQTGYQESDNVFIQNNQLRLFTAHIDTDYLPRKDLQGGAWQDLSTENINSFSAVAYHFGKYLADSLGVPIGLISSNLGATSIEAWMSNEALMQFPQFYPEVKPIVDAGKDFQKLIDDFERIRSSWEKEYYLHGPGITNAWHLPNTDISDWTPFRGPGCWEENGLPDHDGAVWFRTSFDLPAGHASDSFLISLSQIDDYDKTWVNGHLIGETFGRHNHRNYSFPTSICQPTGNTLVVRAFDVGDRGGFTTTPFWTSKIVRGEWHMKPGLAIDAKTFPAISHVNVTPFSSPAVLYNANIAPLTKLPITGFIWYQGESNVTRSEEYGDLFPALIEDWRQQWSLPDLPFLYVQLANYYPERDTPADSWWAEMREAQDQALLLPNTARALAIDLGEADDIHPKDKWSVGQRLGRSALKAAYDQDIIADGPTFDRAEFDRHEVQIFFDQAKGLYTKNKYGYVSGFQIAGEDQVFKWAKAEINGQGVILRSKDVGAPVAARYLWSDNPGQIDLYNLAGLPAAPFRSDAWPLTTAGEKYVPSKSRF